MLVQYSPQQLCDDAFEEAASRIDDTDRTGDTFHAPEESINEVANAMGNILLDDGETECCSKEEGEEEHFAADNLLALGGHSPNPVQQKKDQAEKTLQAMKPYLD